MRTLEAAARRFARVALVCALTCCSCLAGCDKAVEAVDDTADGWTGAGAVRAGQQIEADARRQINDARDRTNAALHAAEGEPADTEE